MIQSIKKYTCIIYVKKTDKQKKTLPVAVLLLKKKYDLIYIIYIAIKIS